MGAVYLAEHDRIGRRDAIKVLNRELAGDESARARFTREARNASFINHPNVCTVYDFGETREGLPFIAMEYVEGRTLTEVLEREGPLPPRRAAELIAQVTRALEAAHARDIVHRDLKSDNVMLARDARGSEVVKVVDFGIAKAMAADEDERQDITRQGLVVGTPQYVSPEQLEGKDLDGRSDIYSLGILLFKVLTGTIPFAGDTWQEVMTKRLSEEPATLREAAPERDFPPELQEVLDRALARDPDRRFQDPRDFREALFAAVREGRGAGATGPAAGAGRGGGGAGGGSSRRAAGGGSGRAGVPETAVGAGAPEAARGTGAEGDRRWRTAAWTAATLVVLGGIVVVGLQQFAPGGDGDGSGSSEGGDVERTGTTDEGAGSGGVWENLVFLGAAGENGSNGGGGATHDTASERDSVRRDTVAPAPSEPVLTEAEAEPMVKRQFDALVMGPPDSRARLATIGDTGRYVWSVRTLPDDLRAWAAHVAGIAYLERGDTLDACPWLERAVRLDPDGEGYRGQLEAVRSVCGS